MAAGADRDPHVPVAKANEAADAIDRTVALNAIEQKEPDGTIAIRGKYAIKVRTGLGMRDPNASDPTSRPRSTTEDASADPDGNR